MPPVCDPSDGYKLADDIIDITHLVNRKKFVDIVISTALAMYKQQWSNYVDRESIINFLLAMNINKQVLGDDSYFISNSIVY